MVDVDRLLKVVRPDPVMVDLRACLPTRHRRSACRACADVCPFAAVVIENGRVQVDAATCQRCGLCAGACPTAALQIRGLDETSLAGASRIRCAHAPGAGGVEVPCLGWLTADHLVDLGSRSPGLELVSGNCQVCPLTRGGEQARQALAAALPVLTALGVEGLPHRVEASAAVGPDVGAAKRPVTRRELFSLWRLAVAQTGQSLKPERRVNPVHLPARVPLRRKNWLGRHATATDAVLSAWPTRQVKEGCIGCDICVAFCPTGALASRVEEGVWELGFTAAACVDCKMCIQLCPRWVVEPGSPPTAAEVVRGEVRVLARVDAAQRPPTTGYRPST